MSSTDKEKKSLTFNVRTLLEILRKDKRKMAVWTCSFGIFGIVVAFSIPREYSTTVTLAPEMSGNSMLSSVTSLASMVGLYNDANPTGDAIYPEDEITDITEREIVEETIREKALNNLEEEVPHGIKVEVENFKETATEEGKYVYNIDVNLICNKKSHKGIIIGKDGSMLKKITNEARRDLENNLDAKIKLKIWVKSRENWQQNENFLNNIKSKI